MRKLGAPRGTLIALAKSVGPIPAHFIPSSIAIHAKASVTALRFAPTTFSKFGESRTKTSPNFRFSGESKAAPMRAKLPIHPVQTSARLADFVCSLPGKSDRTCFKFAFLKPHGRSKQERLEADRATEGKPLPAVELDEK
jgi:hypothetical protein